MIIITKGESKKKKAYDLGDWRSTKGKSNPRKKKKKKKKLGCFSIETRKYGEVD